MKGMVCVCAVVVALALSPAASAQKAPMTPADGSLPMFTSGGVVAFACTGYDERTVYYYTDNTYTTECGRRIETCDGYVAQYGCRTAFHLEQACDCIGF